MQSLHIKVAQVQPNGPSPDGKPIYQWSPDDLLVIEQFFEYKVVTAPYRPQALTGFGRLLNLPPQVLKDFIQIIRLELRTDMSQGLKWNVQLCMRVPPSATPIVPVGQAAILFVRTKILFFVSTYLFSS